LLNVNGLCQDQIGADSKRFGNAGLPFHNGDRKRRLVRVGIPRATKKKAGILLVFAVHDQRIVMLCHQFLDGCEGFTSRIHRKVQITQDMREDTRGFLVRAEQ
jgi:hypothetical protein